MSFAAQVFHVYFMKGVSRIFTRRYKMMNNELMPNLSTPNQIPSRIEMTTTEFDEMMAKGLEQAKNGQGKSLDEAFQIFEASINE